VERAKWTEERLDDRMTVIDTTFDRVFAELREERNRLFEELRAERAENREAARAERAEFRAEMAGLRAELRIHIGELRADIAGLNHRLSQLGFRAAGVLAAGLIALVATQL
jgi:hypothetical protein